MKAIAWEVSVADKNITVSKVFSELQGSREVFIIKITELVASLS